MSLTKREENAPIDEFFLRFSIKVMFTLKCIFFLLGLNDYKADMNSSISLNSNLTVKYPLIRL
jgi:hypothetical protein